MVAWIDVRLVDDVGGQVHRRILRTRQEEPLARTHPRWSEKHVLHRSLPVRCISTQIAQCAGKSGISRHWPVNRRVHSAVQGFSMFGAPYTFQLLQRRTSSEREVGQIG